MRRYRRYRRYRNSTNVIRMKFQSFMDISTDVDSMKIITISAGGKNIIDRCRAQFQAYKYYKLGNVSVKLVPASTLPVDPTGLAYAQENMVDPRDQLSPGLCRITNGEDIFEDISGLSDDYQHKIYNAMMLDPRWFKWMLQKGVKRHGKPRYWQIGQLHQDKWPGANVNMPLINVSLGSVQDTVHEESFHYTSSGAGSGQTVSSYGSSPYGFFQTGHRGVLGWMPTDSLQSISYTNNGERQDVEIPFIASPPEIEMFKIILPKAYKTRYYYRAFISETVFFKDPITCIGSDSGLGNNTLYPLDIFHQIRPPAPAQPGTAYSSDVSDSDTGGNYGND